MAGIYRNMSGSCFNISVEQVFSSAKLRLMKIYSLLKDKVQIEHSTQSCCNLPLSDEESETLDMCFLKIDEISMEEKAALYFIAGFLTRKENLPKEPSPSSVDELPECEFTHFLNRGKLSHPSAFLFHFVQCSHLILKSLSVSCAHRCVFILNHFAKAMYDPNEALLASIVCRRLSNTFLKGAVKSATDSLRTVTPTLSLCDRKRKKFN